jgi:hypothetical protein
MEHYKGSLYGTSLIVVVVEVRSNRFKNIWVSFYTSFEFIIKHEFFYDVAVHQ